MYKFERSSEQLREGFVLGRFAESKVFCNCTIENWLEEQKSFGEYAPWDEKTGTFWLSLVYDCECLAEQLKGREVEILEEYSAEINMDTVEATQYMSDCAWEVYKILNPETAPCYPITGPKGRISHILVLAKGMKPLRVLLPLEGSLISGEHPQKEWIFRPADCLKVLQSVLATWVLGREKASKARTFLLEQLGKAIAKERQRAGNDFDLAVAVSDEDTPSITCADKVVVFNGDPHCVSPLLFPSASFQNSKIHRGTVQRKKVEVTSVRFLRGEAVDSWSIGSIYSHVCRTDQPCQVLIEAASKEFSNSELILFTDRDHCPEILPAGASALPVLPKG